MAFALALLSGARLHPAEVRWRFVDAQRDHHARIKAPS